MPLVTDIRELTIDQIWSRLRAYERALNRIAEWQFLHLDLSELDEPHSAAIARHALEDYHGIQEAKEVEGSTGVLGCPAEEVGCASGLPEDNVKVGEGVSVPLFHLDGRITEVSTTSAVPHRVSGALECGIDLSKPPVTPGFPHERRRVRKEGTGGEGG